MSDIKDMTRQEEIRAKGFSMSGLEFGAMKVNKKLLEDVTLDLGALKTVNRTFTNKRAILKALADKDVTSLREISDYFYRTSGIYFRVCNYFAQMYRYDWYIVPEVYDNSVKEEKMVTEFNKVLNYLDNSYIKKVCGDIALQVIKNGAYYGIVVPSKNGVVLQELPAGYCRSRYQVGNMPAIELNMKFFDEKFSDAIYRMRVLKTFPEDIQKGYVLYKQGKLPADMTGTTGSWYML